MTTPPTMSTAPAGTPRRRLALVCGVLLVAVTGAVVVWMAAGRSEPVTNPIEPAPADSAAPVEGPPWFRDMTAASGVRFTYRNGEEAGHLTILESLGGGVALVDYDNDGLLDLFLTGGGSFDRTRQDYPQDPSAYQEALRKTPPRLLGHPCKLYRNRGHWKFEDVSSQVGFDAASFYSHGVAVADYDRDGWADLLVTGYGRLALLHNEPARAGGRRFVDVTGPAGLDDASWSTSAGWGDLEGDGWPDLYVCHYADWSFANHPACKGMVPGVAHDICPPERFRPLVHALFRNDQGRSFRNVAQEHGFRAAGCGLGVVLADLNGDARPDVYVANDTNPNFLYFNRGKTLEEKALTAGAAVDERGQPNGSMGVDVGDYDGSGRPSLWVTNFQGELHALYRNVGRETFLHQSRAAGAGAIGQNFVGFGTGFVDADNDGWEDLVFVNGHVFRAAPGGQDRKQRPVLLRNVLMRGRRFFQDISPQGGAFFQTPTLGRGLAVGDLDNDGWSDLVVSHTNEPAALLRNEAARAPAAHWLGVRLVGRDRRDIVGSTVVLEESGRRLTRFARGGGSYLSAGDPRLLFGLGASGRPVRVTVQWSWGQTQVWDGLEPDRYWELHEGQPAAQRVEIPSP